MSVKINEAHKLIKSLMRLSKGKKEQFINVADNIYLLKVTVTVSGTCLSISLAILLVLQIKLTSKRP